MKEQKINPVESNEDKALTYAQQKGRYKQAMKMGFFYEAIVIDYALMEDRLRSFLYHAGVLVSRTSFKIDCNKKNKKVLKRIYCDYREENNVNLPNISNISGKRDIINAVLTWASTTTEVPENIYFKALKNQCESLDVQEMRDVFDAIKNWCSYRDEIIHALMNKNLISLQSELEEKAEEGMELANKLDTFVREMKKGNKVRKAAGFKMD